ncbi:neuronal acetylcholine receptor subunit alpha-2-like [Haliotis rufescens]|uniref:neuronal acetylcholine receptor subunit alpha-2-like n=1 Tax=Haliotis rufescens TaxID=6454 RepID=UPI00201E7FA0|nr:neuronal acetylcholine receptor subunit alpha-2-like [Haliotis rufescens]
MNDRYVLMKLILCSWSIFSSVVSEDDAVAIRRRLVTDSLKDYVVNVPPSSNGTVNVSVNFYLQSMVDLDEREQTMTTNGWLNVVWMDPALAWSQTDYNVSDVSYKQKDIWVPDLVISNSLKPHKAMGYDDLIVFMFSNGTMMWSPGDLYKTECALDTTYFPFDTQTCKIVITKWMMYECVWLNLLDAAGVMTSTGQNSVWNIAEISKHLEHSYPPYTPNVVVLIKLNRCPSYYVLNLFLPVLFISLLIPLVFALPMDQGEQISFIMTIMLSFVVFLTLLSDTLPKTSRHVSVVTIYITLLLVISALSVFLTILTQKVSNLSDSKPIPSWTRKLCDYKSTSYAGATERLSWTVIANTIDDMFMFVLFILIIGINITSAAVVAIFSEAGLRLSC